MAYGVMGYTVAVPAEYQAEGFGMLPSILQTYARGGGGLMEPTEPEIAPEIAPERKVTEPPVATAARLHVQHAAVQSRELFA